MSLGEIAIHCSICCCRNLVAMATETYLHNCAFEGIGTNVPWPNRQTLFGKHFKFCLSSTRYVSFTTSQTHTWQTFFVTSKKCFWKFQKRWQAKCAYQAMLFVVAKCTTIFDKQNLKCLPNNVGPFSRALRKTQGFCVADLVTLSDENRSS